MRHSRQEDLLRLAVRMQGSVEGVSVSDIGQTFGVSRRMAERMRDAVLRAFPNWRSVPVRRPEILAFSNGTLGKMLEPIYIPQSSG